MAIMPIIIGVKTMKELELIKHFTKDHYLKGQFSIKDNTVYAVTSSSMLLLNNVKHTTTDGHYSQFKLDNETPVVINDGYLFLNDNKVSSLSITVKSLKLFASHLSKDLTRLNLCSLYLDGDTLVSCDGHRLFKQEVTTSNNRQLLISQNFVTTALKLANFYKLKTLDIKFTIDSSFIQTNDFTLIDSLVEREYPRYQAVIPTKIDTFTSINLLDIIGLSGIKTSDLTKRKSISIIRDMSHVMSVKYEDRNGFNVFTADSVPESFDVLFSVNLKYLKDYMALGYTNINVNLGTLAPIVSNDFNAVLMPVKA